jgi:hypothetical protein
MGNGRPCERWNRMQGGALVIMLVSLFSMSAQAQSRMPAIPDDEMTAAQREAVAEFRTERGEPTGPWYVTSAPRCTGMGGSATRSMPERSPSLASRGSST